MTSHIVTRNPARLPLAFAFGAVLILAGPARAADERGSVQGVVNDASGKPVAGAFVKLKNADRRLTFMVISQDGGRFEAKDLPPGSYKVQGVGAGFQSDWLANVSVAMTMVSAAPRVPQYFLPCIALSSFSVAQSPPRNPAAVPFGSDW